MVSLNIRMDLIILGGNSPANQLWTEGMEKTFKQDFGRIVKIDYDHWRNEKPLINLDIEVDKLAREADGKKVVIFAKSAGNLVTLKAIYGNRVKPNKCVFMGVPIDWARQNNFDLPAWLTDYSVPTLFIQQEDDPFGSFSNLKELLEEKQVQNYTLEQVPGNDHGYTNFEEIRKLYLKFAS